VIQRKVNSDGKPDAENGKKRLEDFRTQVLGFEQTGRNHPKTKPAATVVLNHPQARETALRTAKTLMRLNRAVNYARYVAGAAALDALFFAQRIAFMRYLGYDADVDPQIFEKRFAAMQQIANQFLKMKWPFITEEPGELVFDAEFRSWEFVSYPGIMKIEPAKMSKIVRKRVQDCPYLVDSVHGVLSNRLCTICGLWNAILICPKCEVFAIYKQCRGKNCTKCGTVIQGT
jgi:hypothetical protein